MIYLKRVFTVISIMSLLFFIQGCSDSPTDSNEGGGGGGGGGVDQSSVFVSLLSVAVVPGGSESIEVTATDVNGEPDTFTATCDDGAVATVTQNGSEITVTGIDFGETIITITGSGGVTKEVPVQVYDHTVLDTGELLITFVDEFSYIWNGGWTNETALYYPVLPEGYRALGSLEVIGYANPDGNFAMMVVKAKEGSDALAEPVDYQFIWQGLSGGVPTAWKPIPPDGYRAMGSVFTSGWSPPTPSKYVCVREDLTTRGSAGSWIWSDAGSGQQWWDISCWKINPPLCEPHDFAYLHTGTFVAWNDLLNPPELEEDMNVLNVELPMLSEAPYQPYIPQLDSYDTPPEETVPVMSKVTLVPCTIISDSLYAQNLPWRIANSPFYRLERQVFYKRLYHNYNQTSELQTNQVTITSGITTEQSEEVWEETGIEMSVEAGMSISAFTGSVTVSVSKSMGYSSTHSIAELQETEISSSINTPPGKAATLWQKYNRFVLYRHDGTDLEPVYAWEFGIDSYLTDEYPGE